jgi:serine/threonine protein kinase
MSVRSDGLGRQLRELIATSRIHRLAARVTDLWAARMEDRIDAVMLGRYELDRVVGRGSHGVVFAVYDRALEREVALEVFGVASDRDVLNEARALARVNHPNVVALHDVGHASGFVYLVMALVDGWAMAERVRMGLEWRAVVELFVAAGRGLAAAHRLGVVHGDVKPGNILVGRDGSVCIADFGLSRTRERTEPPHAGTREYLAPECWAGADASPRSDQFSFCVALWEALYGARPWGSNHVPTRFEREPAEPRSCGDVPAQLEQALRRGLAAQPRDCYSDIHALIDELEDALQWGAT